MRVFDSDGRETVIWGPTASVEVNVPAMGSVIWKDSWVLDGVTIGAKEIVDVRQCFGDVAYIYALGNDQGKCLISLSFVIFLGKKNCTEGTPFESIDDGLSAYAGNRISIRTGAQPITIGGFSRNAWLIGIDIGNTEAGKSISHGNVSFMMELEK